MPRESREEWKVYRGVFDQFTLHLLDKMQGTHLFDELLSPVKVGKESAVFLASKGAGKVIVKVYRLEACDFNKMFDYIKYDPRYTGLNRNRRRIIFAWAQREYRNLLKAREAGVNCPLPIKCVNHILIESLIGDDAPALQLKDHQPGTKQKLFNQVVENMISMHRAGIVHGDLSAFNILVHKNVPYIIDFSQSTERRSPLYQELLERDVRNVCAFFRKVGVKADEGKVMAKILKSLPSKDTED